MENILAGLDLPEEVATTLTERINQAKNEWIEGARNNPDFISKIRKEEAGKFFKSQEKAYRRTFPDLALEDIDGEGVKRMEAILKAGVAQLQEGSTATNQEMQQKYLDAVAEYTKYKDEDVPLMIEAERTKFHSKFINDGILKDSLEFETTCDPELRTAAVELYLQKNGWKSVWNDSIGDYEFQTVEGNLKPTKDDKPLTKNQIIGDSLSAAGVLKKSKGSSPSEPGDPPPMRKAGELSENAQKMLSSFQTG